MLHKKDTALQTTIPTLMVPLFSPFEPLAQPGDRILMASNGVFVEVARTWGYFVRRICAAPSIAVPYGAVEEATMLRSEAVPKPLLVEFSRQAAAECDVEIGGAIVWNEASGQFRLVRSHAKFADGDALEYVLPTMGVGDHLIVDCHSHAHHSAFFSDTDDTDDAASTKFAFVVGNCDQEVQSVAMRLCVKGLFEPIPVDIGFFNQQNETKEAK